jgi:integrase/recombinase XerD
MTFNRRWQITSDKFLSLEQIERLKNHLINQRDLAIARGTDQAIRDHYAIMALLESGLRVFEFCALVNGDFQGLKLLVRRGKGNKPRTVLLTRATSLMLKEWIAVKARLGHSLEHGAPLFPSRYGTTYSTRGMQKRVKLIFSALAFPVHLSVHSLRHTYCSLLLASGKVGLATVKENLGHHSIAVTNLYAHAVGDLSEVNLYPKPSSQKAVFSELEATSKAKKTNSSVNTFLRNVNFK